MLTCTIGSQGGPNKTVATTIGSQGGPNKMAAANFLWLHFLKNRSSIQSFFLDQWGLPSHQCFSSVKNPLERVLSGIPSSHHARAFDKSNVCIFFSRLTPILLYSSDDALKKIHLGSLRVQSKHINSHLNTSPPLLPFNCRTESFRSTQPA